MALIPFDHANKRAVYARLKGESLLREIRLLAIGAEGGADDMGDRVIFRHRASLALDRLLFDRLVVSFQIDPM